MMALCEPLCSSSRVSRRVVSVPLSAVNGLIQQHRPLTHMQVGTGRPLGEARRGEDQERGDNRRVSRVSSFRLTHCFPPFRHSDCLEDSRNSSVASRRHVRALILGGHKGCSRLRFHRYIRLLQYTIKNHRQSLLCKRRTRLVMSAAELVGQPVCSQTLRIPRALRLSYQCQ